MGNSQGRWHSLTLEKEHGNRYSRTPQSAELKNGKLETLKAAGISTQEAGGSVAERRC
jgi:hypothetical protein